MQINVVDKEKLKFCDLSLGDTFYMGKNLYVKINELTDGDGDTINTLCLDNYFACYCYPHDFVEKCDSVLYITR